MFDRRIFSYLDWFLVLLMLGIAGIGVINLYSASAAQVGAFYCQRQLMWWALGGGVIVFMCSFHYRRLKTLAYWGYGAALLLLMGVLTLGKTSMGATRWLELGGLNVQPSEITKLAVVVVLARYLSNLSLAPEGLTGRQLVTPFILVGAPMALILKQPDLGTALLVLFIAGTVLLATGIQGRPLLVLLILGCVCAGGGWFTLQDYQKARIQTFLHPESDPLGSGYHIIQSKIAIGSGGLFGQGFQQGTQSQLAFLPERHTDFAFAVFAEEWGLTGCVLVLGFYTLLLLRGIHMARQTQDLFGRYLALGICVMLFWHTIVNLGMVMGVLPVVGVPLPLFSYGGTNLLTTLVGIGLLLNVGMRRFQFYA